MTLCLTKETKNDPHIVIEPPHGWQALELGDLWKYRELLYFLTWRDIKVRYKQTALGAAWAILQPLLTMVVFSVIFGQVGQTAFGRDPVPDLHLYGLLPWQLFAFALTESSNSLVGSQNLVSKIYFPRLVIPICVGVARAGGFCDLFRGAAGDDGLLRDPTDAPCPGAAGVPAAGAGDGAGGGPVAIGAERRVSRHTLCCTVPDQFWQYRDAGGLFRAR